MNKINSYRKDKSPKASTGKSPKPSPSTPHQKEITPFCQLFRELKSQEEKDILFEQVEPLRDEYHDDLCLSILAYLKFGIPRVFDNQLMQVIYEAYRELLDKNRKGITSHNK